MVLSCLYVCVLHNAWYPWRSEEGTSPPGTGVMGDYKPPCGCWESNPNPLCKRLKYSRTLSHLSSPCLLSSDFFEYLCIYLGFFFKLLLFFYRPIITPLPVVCPPTVSYPIPPSSCLQEDVPPLRQTSPLTGASSLLRVRHIFSHWGQTKQEAIFWFYLYAKFF